MQPNARLILYCFIVSAKPGGRNHSGHHGETGWTWRICQCRCNRIV